MPILVESAQVGSNVASLAPDVVDLGPSSAEVRPIQLNLPSVGRSVRGTLVDSLLSLSDSGPSLIEFGRLRAKVGRAELNQVELGPHLVDTGLNSAVSKPKFDHVGPKLDSLDRLSGCFGRTWAANGPLEAASTPLRWFRRNPARFDSRWARLDSGTVVYVQSHERGLFEDPPEPESGRIGATRHGNSNVELWELQSGMLN